MNIEKLSSPRIFESSARNFARLTLVLAAALFAVCSTRAQVDAYVQLIDASGNPVVSESQDSFFKGSAGWFKVDNFELGVSNTVTFGAGSTPTAGKAHFTDFKITKKVDKTSTTLFKNAASGMHFKTVTLALRKSAAQAPAGSADPSYLKYELTEVFVSKVEWAGADDDAPSESVTFVYSRLNISYRAQDSTGSMLDPVSATWDIVLNKAG